MSSNITLIRNIDFTRFRLVYVLFKYVIIIIFLFMGVLACNLSFAKCVLNSIIDLFNDTNNFFIYKLKFYIFGVKFE